MQESKMKKLILSPTSLDIILPICCISAGLIMISVGPIDHWLYSMSIFLTGASIGALLFNLVVIIKQGKL